jgi:organic radical activating enzyme
MEKHNICEAVFSITEVCNLNCPQCHRFSNYNVTGHYRWEDYAEEYRQWTNLVVWDNYTLLGGEPMANKGYKDWVKGLYELNPNARGKILTNGSYLRADDDELYNLLKDYNCEIEIGLHNEDRWEEIKPFLDNFFKGRVYAQNKYAANKNFVDSYNNIKASDWPEISNIAGWEQLSEHIRSECDRVFNFTPDKFLSLLMEKMWQKAITPSDETDTEERAYENGWIAEDDNGVLVACMVNDKFYESALIPNFETQSFTIHNSDPEVAHAGCGEARQLAENRCGQFIRGKLWKCNVSENLARMDQEFTVHMTEEFREKINAYKPISSNITLEEFYRQRDEMNKPIPHCVACTQSYELTKFKATTKKTIFMKKV